MSLGVFFGIQLDFSPLQPRRVLNNPRVAVAPLNAGGGEEAHSAVPSVDLKPIVVMLDFMHPAETGRRPLSDRGLQVFCETEKLTF